MKTDEIKKALSTLQDLKNDVEYSINKARENQARKTISTWNKPKKDKLKYKLSRPGILLPKKASENFWLKENIQIEETIKNGKQAHTATAWLGHGEYVEFDITKRKAVPATLVFSNHKLGNAR